MSAQRETELLAQIHEVLQTDYFSTELEVWEAFDENESPILVVTYHGKRYAIGVVALEERESLSR